MHDTLIRLVLVGTTAVPAFALGFWAGLRAQRTRRRAVHDAGPPAGATPLFRDGGESHAGVEPLQPAARRAGGSAKRPE